MALQRVALLRLAPGIPSRQGGPDGRRWRRTVWRLSPLPYLSPECPFGNALRRRAGGGAPFRADLDRLDIAPVGIAAPQARPHVPRPGGQPRIAVPRKLPGGVLTPRNGRDARPPGRCGHRVRELCRALDRRRGPDRARPAALCRPEDVPRRTAHETGPDEHGMLDRKPRSLSRPPAGRVCGPRARPAED